MFFLDKGNKFYQKSLIFLISITILIVIDIQFGFSTHVFYDNKINELQKVSSIINDPKTDSLTKSIAVDIRKNIYNRDNIYSFLFSSFSEIFSKSVHAVAPKRESTNINDNPKNNANIDSIRNNLLFYISFCIYWTFGLIPKISHNTWNWNYLLNFLIQSLIIFTFYKKTV